MDSPKNIRTQAYVVQSKGAPFELKDVILDEVQPNEVLVEMKHTGICHTDIVVQNGGMPIGDYPAVLGHEGMGIVRWIGSTVCDKSLTLGDTVCLSFHSCGQCAACRDDQCGSCPDMTEINFLNTARRGTGASTPISLPDGTPVHGQFFGQSSLSRMAVVTEASIVKLDARPEEIPFLAPLGCGYLTGSGTVLNVLKPRPDDTIVVLGLGAVGFAALMAAKALGLKSIVAVDLLGAKLEIASALGATHIINTSIQSDLGAELQKILPTGAKSIIDTTGSVALLEICVKSLAHAGTLALVGVPSPQATLNINALDLLLSCKRIVGVIEGWSNAKLLVPQLLQLSREGKFPIDRLAKVYPAEKLCEAIEDLKLGVVVKPILSW
ncbi:hypothetical protein N7456_008206 [Penicillium angulare]|uniref:Enoyl reductase (ER) domain-containing protein n=1 Tax=Penicillium angulare TaxID=116970 RepID=A0A9W9K944_9EURO|nr:hypothetical protein N7456_008206 [Penicillium angulare]